MKYFTKYLPVEGKIESHSMALLDAGFNNASIVRVMSTAKYYSNVSSEGDNWDTMTDRLKTVQLFLCSRNIEVGDKVWDTLNEKFCEVTTPFVALQTSDGENVPCWYLKTEPVTFHEARFLIKVLGPISPETTWVKEGDEFEEDQVQEWFWHKDQKVFMFRANEEWVPKFLEITKDGEFYERGYYKIKGPCGYFH